MIRKTRLLGSLSLLLACLLLTGCGDGFTRAVVSGQVAYQEVPVKDGMIRFLLLPGIELPSAGAQIIDAI